MSFHESKKRNPQWFKNFVYVWSIYSIGGIIAHSLVNLPILTTEAVVVFLWMLIGAALLIDILMTDYERK